MKTNTANNIPWTQVFSFADGMDAARASVCCNRQGGWTRKDIDQAMEAMLRESDDLGRSLLRRHGQDLPLSKLVFCIDIDEPVRDPLAIQNQWTFGDMYQASDLDMTWCRVLFVIDGIAVYERVLGHVGFTRFPVARLPLPYLLDIVSVRPFLDEEIDGQDEMEMCWEDGWHQFEG